MDLLFDEGIHIFHFGYSDAEYKQRFGTDYIEGATLNFYTNTPKASLVRLTEIGSLYAHTKAKEILKSLGILALLRNLWRKRLRTGE